jgi:hypothetical protein
MLSSELGTILAISNLQQQTYMKLIQAMKQVKSLLVKADDLRTKIAAHSAHLSIETPVYKEQATIIQGWLQSHEDLMQEIAKLKVAITRTNLVTNVTIELGEKQVTKSIAEWIVRRGDSSDKKGTAMLDLQAWKALTDRNLREGQVPSSSGGPTTPVTIVRCYDPIKRDQKVALYQSEPQTIDATLEVANAITDVIFS